MWKKIAIPSFSGAMENFGAIVYMEIWLLIEESQTGASEVRKLPTIISK